MSSCARSRTATRRSGHSRSRRIYSNTSSIPSPSSRESSRCRREDKDKKEWGLAQEQEQQQAAAVAVPPAPVQRSPRRRRRNKSSWTRKRRSICADQARPLFSCSSLFPYRIRLSTRHSSVVALALSLLFRAIPNSKFPTDSHRLSSEPASTPLVSALELHSNRAPWVDANPTREQRQQRRLRQRFTPGERAEERRRQQPAARLSPPRPRRRATKEEASVAPLPSMIRTRSICRTRRRRMQQCPRAPRRQPRSCCSAAPAARRRRQPKLHRRRLAHPLLARRSSSQRRA